MQLVEQHRIGCQDPRWAVIDEACFSSKNLYNAANYIAGIDIGLDNLAAVTFNQPGLLPLLVNGRPLKVINASRRIIDTLGRTTSCEKQSRTPSSLCLTATG